MSESVSESVDTDHALLSHATQLRCCAGARCAVMARLWYLLPAGWAAPSPNPNPNPNSNQGGPRRPESPYHLLLDVIRSEALTH